MSVQYIQNLDNLNLIESNNNEKLFDFIIDNWSKQKFLTLGFIYFAIFAKIKSDKQISSFFKSYDLLLPDGIGLKIYFKKVFKLDIPNLNGTDLLPLFINYLDNKKLKYSFYGTTKENILLASKKYNSYYFQDGFSDLDFSKIEDNTILFLGLGTPNQELFINKHMEMIKSKSLLVISTGGFFDFQSGNVKRAPLFIRKMNLEFLFRLIINPRQHFKKNLLNFLLIYYILKDKLHVR